MRRILLAAAGTLAGVVAIFSYPTSTGGSVATAEPSGTVSTDSSSTGTSSGTFSATTSMRYGTVTVTITVDNGTITDVSGSQSSVDSRSQTIASQAIPTLDSEAVSAQSADISLVSHATFTSQAYAQSLQQAIDQAFGS